NPYLEEPLRSCERIAGPPAEPAFLQEVALPAPLPPPALLPFVPLSMLPFPIAAAIYALALVAAMTLAVAILVPILGVSSLVLNLVFAPITATVTYFVGQPVPIALLALALAARDVRRRRWPFVGIWLGIATIEPHVALPALLGVAIAIPAARIAVGSAIGVLAATSIGAVGLPVTMAYGLAVLPAHALANAYEWQFSLTSVLTSLGANASVAIHLGETMFVAMMAAGIAIAWRVRRMTADDAVMVLVPPAFAVCGGVHVHFQQLVVAFPAILYAMVRFPRIRLAAASGLALVMIPWNVMGTTLLAGAIPVLVGSFCAATTGRRTGVVLSAFSGCVVISIFLLIYLGLGPVEHAFVAHHYAPEGLAETSWADFSRAALGRPSILMQWLRVPTLTGLVCGLVAIVRT
ncbi:MAG: glycosyltransferase 87 family protein, partial [Vulcanimicrobiaceae bacterium]